MQAKGHINLQFTKQILISEHWIFRIQDSLKFPNPLVQVSATKQTHAQRRNPE